MTIESTLNQWAVATVSIVTLSLGLSSAPALSATISGTISGIVTQSGGGNPPSLTVGSPVLGSYSYDDAVVVTDSFGDSVNPLATFNLQIGTNPRVFTLADLDPTLSTPGRRIGLSTSTRDILGFFFYFPVLYSFVGATSTESAQTIFFPLTGPQSFAFDAPDPTGDFAFDFTSTPIPTPALLPGLIGLALGVWRKRQAEGAIKSE